MLSLWPEAGRARPLTDAELQRAYAYPEGLRAPYIRANFVSSVDGAAWLDGVSAGLSSASDRRVFRLLRELCEVILVGAGTVRAERYRGARRPSRVTGAPPRIAVVTSSAELDPTGPLFTDTTVAPLVLTTPQAPPERLRLLGAAGAEVDSRGTTPERLVAALAERGLYRVLCEGGPALFGELINADVVDELCLTLAPLLVGGTAGRIARGALAPTNRLRLAGVLVDKDASDKNDKGTLLLRYRRAR